jgi:hypothetical protein
MQLSKPASSLAPARTLDDLGRLPRFEPGDPSAHALAARDEARVLASEAAEVGESWEAEIAAHKAAMRAEEEQAAAAHKAACKAAAVALRASRAALGSVRVAALPVPGALLATAGDAIDAAALLVAGVTEPFLSKVLGDQKAELSRLITANREMERQIGEACWALIGAECAIRKGTLRDAATALNAARSLIKASKLTVLVARLATADAAYQTRLGVRRAG